MSYEDEGDPDMICPARFTARFRVAAPPCCCVRVAMQRKNSTIKQFHRSGRAKDARRHHGEAEETRADRESGAKLEYRDQWGREITRKEAFRNLCYQVRLSVGVPCVRFLYVATDAMVWNLPRTRHAAACWMKPHKFPCMLAGIITACCR